MERSIIFILGLILASLNAKPVTIAIIGTNDIHGSAFPTNLMRSDTLQQYNYGGLAYMGRLIQIIQSEYPQRSIYLDAGDQFQGGIQSSSLISSGKIMNDFYSALGIQGSAIGNHQFDFGPQFLFPFMASKSTNLAANIHSQSNQVNFLPNQESSKLFTLADGVKIGVIGLATLQTPSTTAGFQKNLFPPYKFLQYKDVVEAQAKKLRKQGADAVIILGHVGNDCPQKLQYGIWTKQTLQSVCPKDQITNLIDALPAGTIDAIVQGHRHRIVHHFYRNIPFMGSINGGYYFNVMYLTFGEPEKSGIYEKRRKIIDVKIEGPIPVCQKIFQNLGRCNYLSPSQLSTAGSLISWAFHNKPVYPHAAIQTIYTQEWLPKMQPYLEKLTNNQAVLVISSKQQNQLGNLITNLLHQAVPDAQFVIMNPGGFRTQWLPGILQFQHFYNMFPFDNIAQSFSIYGHELKSMLKIIQEGSKGYYQTWGLQTTVREDIDGMGKETRSFVNAQFWNGTEIDDQKQYRGVSIDFLLGGGDDFKDVIGKVYTPRTVKKEGTLRDLLKPKLIGWGTIKPGTLIDPNHPRLIIQYRGNRK